MDFPSTGTSWNLLVTYELNKDWYLSSINNFATKSGTDAFSIAYVDLTGGRNFGGGWAVDAGYRSAWVDIGGITRDEHRPLVNVKWRRGVQGWFLLNRARLEYRDFADEGMEDRFRLRNQTLVVSPWKVPGTNARWFAEEEFFFETNGSGFNLNWLTTGFRFRLSEQATGKLGYRWHAQKLGGEWFTRHVFAAGVNLQL